MRAKIFLSVFILAALPGAHSFAAVISSASIVSDWSAQLGVTVNVNNALWSLSGSSVSNGGNRTGSFISDFVASGDYSFSTDIVNQADNDWSGILFGFSDAANSYGLGWGGGGVTGFNGIQLFKEVGGVRTLLASQSGNWISGRQYNFSVERTGSEIKATIIDTVANSNIFTATVNDTTFSSGNVGFETWSQQTLFGVSDSTNFAARNSAVPEPASIAIFGMIFGLAALRGRRP